MVFFKYLLKIFFLLLLIVATYYIIEIESEKYESKAIVMVKDLAQKPNNSSPLGSLLSGNSSEMKDAKLLEVYIKSYDMYDYLDKEYNLSNYYTSKKIDPLNRLFYIDYNIPFQMNRENLLENYRADLTIVYDEPSTTLEISFAHVDSTLAQKIVNSIIVHAKERLNLFEKENTKIVLKFLKEQKREKYKIFISSLKALLDYQSKHRTIDPKIDIESKSAILATLEAELVEKEVDYNSKRQYLSSSSPEMKLLKGNIAYVKQSISKIKKQITGKKGKEPLNVDLSDFSLLKSEVEFNKDIYRQILVKLEETKFAIQQKSKNLIVVAHPTIADSYKYPNKIKNIITLYIVMFFIYAILNLIITLIREHKD